MEGLEDCDPLDVNSAQKLLTWMGYQANGFARICGRSIEHLMRPMPKNGTLMETAERVKHAVSALFSLPLAALLGLPALACYALAACAGRGRFERVLPESPAEPWQQRSVKVMSLNACFQDPWSPLTGGVVPPFEPVADSPSRIAAIVDAIARENPAVFMGQEFESLGAQAECIRLLQRQGYRYFLRDLGANDPIRNNSGLFVASKVPLKNVSFVPYPAEDRTGLAKWSQQGALAFTISLQGRDLQLVNVHLNYGEGPENQAARNRQLTRHVVPLLRQGNSALFGDLNFDTSSVDRADSGLSGLVNALEGRVTCTDAGKHALRGKPMPSDGSPCPDCAERIDALVYNPSQIQVLECDSRPLQLGNQLLSDHSATVATLALT